MSVYTQDKNNRSNRFKITYLYLYETYVCSLELNMFIYMCFEKI